MTVNTKVAARTVHNGRISIAGSLALMAAALLLVPAAVQAAGSGPYKPSDAVSFEEIPGSTVKRVILKERAAERLGIELGEVSEETILLKQMVGGLIVPPVNDPPESTLLGGSFGGFGQTTEVAMKETGVTARTMISVACRMAGRTSSDASKMMRAVDLSLPALRCWRSRRTMFSTSMIASSTTEPKATINPASTMTLIVAP